MKFYPRVQHSYPMDMVISGGTGFVGREIVRDLAQSSYFPTLVHRNEEKLQTIFPSYTGNTLLWDLENPGNEYIADSIANSTVAVHLAANVAEGTWNTAAQILRSNIVQGLHFLHALPSACNHVVFFSSTATYGESGVSQISEEHPTNPSNMYGVAKLALEGFFRLFGRANNKTVTILRVSSVYGPGMPAKRAIAQFIDSLVSDKPLEWNVNPKVVRNYIHVRDVAHALSLVLAAGRRADGVYNICAKRPSSIAEIMGLLKSITGKQVQCHLIDDPAYLPASLYEYDVTKAERDLGFSQLISLSHGLSEMHEYLSRGANEQTIPSRS